MPYNSPNPSHERLVCLNEREIKEIATGSNYQWYIVTIVVFLICAFVGFIIALYMAQLLAGLKI